MNLKRILAILVAASLMLTGLAACGSSNQPAGNGGAATTPAESSTPADAAAPTDAAAPADTGAASNNADWSNLSKGRRTAMEFDTGGSVTATSTKTFDLKLAHVSALEAPYHVASEYMAQLIENRTNGNVKITVYGAGQLGNATETIEALQMNTLDFTVVGAAPLINFVPDFGLLDIPFIFDGFDHAYAVLDGQVGQNVLGALENYSIKGLAFWEGYFQTIHTNSPVNSAADIKGKKIRTMENEMHMAFITNLGGVALPMAFSEVYNALDNGTVDGVSTDMPFYTSGKFYIPAPYSTMTMHIYSSAPMMASKATWDKLPEDYQQIIQEAALEAGHFQRWYNAYYVQKDVEFTKTQGATYNYPTDEEMEPYREAGRKVQESVIPSRFSQELIDAIRNTSWTESNIIGWYEAPNWWE